MEDAIRARALELGFSQVGFCRAAGPLEPPGRLEDWLGAGLHAGMSYLQRAPDERRDARSLLPEAKAIVAVAAAYAPAAASSPIASYALQQDYHRALAERLEELLAFIHSLHPGARGLVCVDSKPLLERRAAALAGLGWIGKNTMVMNAADGPWLLLGELIVSVDLAPDAPQESRCGACRACLDACPTGALAAPFVLDARRCLSYWTIEHRGPAPEWVREAQGTRLFGCDECLAACPFGRAALCERASPLLAAAPELRDMGPEALIDLIERGFNRNLRRHALARAGKAGLLRNCLTALGNGGDRAAHATLERYARHEDEGVRSHAAWALARLAHRGA